MMWYEANVIKPCVPFVMHHIKEIMIFQLMVNSCFSKYLTDSCFDIGIPRNKLEEKFSPQLNALKTTIELSLLH